jgi:hypothetical protein
MPLAQAGGRGVAIGSRATSLQPRRWTDAIPEPPRPGRLVTASVIAVSVATLVATPRLGILLLVSVVPAQLITSARARRRWLQGRPMSIPGRVLLFIELAILLPIASVVVLLAIGFGPGFIIAWR